jgi:hypothetical protein
MLAWTVHRDGHYHDQWEVDEYNMLAAFFWASGLFIEALANEQR